MKAEFCPLLSTQAVRLIKLDDRLRSGARPNFRGLLEAGVSAATLKRDLHFLRHELGAPIEWDAQDGSYGLAGDWPGLRAVLAEQLRAV